MTWLDMVSMSIAAVAGLECVVGRLAQLDRRKHRAGELVQYAVGAVLCIVSASLTWQGIGIAALEVLATVIAGYLLLTWGDWRHGPPLQAWRGVQAVQAGDVMPSRIDDAGR